MVLSHLPLLTWDIRNGSKSYSIIVTEPLLWDGKMFCWLCVYNLMFVSARIQRVWWNRARRVVLWDSCPILQGLKERIQNPECLFWLVSKRGIGSLLGDVRVSPKFWSVTSGNAVYATWNSVINSSGGWLRKCNWWYLQILSTLHQVYLPKSIAR